VAERFSEVLITFASDLHNQSLFVGQEDEHSLTVKHGSRPVPLIGCLIHGTLGSFGIATNNGAESLALRQEASSPRLGQLGEDIHHCKAQAVRVCGTVTKARLVYDTKPFQDLRKDQGDKRINELRVRS
jgi:hypothetical protein